MTNQDDKQQQSIFDQRWQRVGTQYNAAGNIHITEADKAHDVRGLANPYLGLAAFTYAEREKYAGRDTQIAEAVVKLATPGEQRVLLFVTGASGSGKSSFAQAGLIPALEQHYQTRHQQVRHAVFRPSKQPLAMLVDALHQLGIPADSVGDAATFAAILRQHTPAQTINVIIIDQFEELFTQSEPGQRDAFFALLTHLLPFAELRTHLIATVRADYLPELFLHPALYGQVKDGIELRVMTEDELKQAIQHPLQQHPDAKDRHFEQALLDRLARDAAADAAYLPLLQATLARLWGGGVLKLSAYGSLADAIQQQSEDVYLNSLDGTPRPEAEQQAILALLLEMVDVSPTDDDHRDVRRRRDLAAILHPDPTRRGLVTELATARLLSTGRETRAGDDVEVVDIIHESLLSKWARLKQAIDAERETLQQQTRFKLALDEWLEREQDDAYLLSGVRLSEAEQLAASNNVEMRNEQARDFLQRSRTRRDAQRKRQLQRVQLVAVVLAVLLLLALGAGWFAFDQQQAAVEEADARATAEANAEERAREAEQQANVALSRQLAAQVNVLTDNIEYDTALLLGTQALAITSTLEAQDALFIGTQTKIMSYLHTYTSSVESVAFSPDGRTLATGSPNKTIILWDVATRQPRATLDSHTHHIYSVAFSPDGRTLASSGWDGTVILWNVLTGQTIATLEGHTGTVNSVAFSPDGKFLASGSNSTVIIWHVATSQPRTTLEDHVSTVSSVMFSPDGQTIVSSSRDGTIILWDVATGMQQATLTSHADNVESVAFSPDGTTLAYGSSDDTIILWDLATEQLLVTLEGHTGTVNSVAFSPDGKLLASGGSDKTIILWDVVTGQLLATLEGHTDWIKSIVFSPDSKILASGSQDGTIILWDMMIGKLSNSLKDRTISVGHVTFSPDSHTLASSNCTRNDNDESLEAEIILWDVAAEQSFSTLKSPESSFHCSDIAFSPDGQTIISSSRDGTIILWDVATGTQQATLTGHTGGVSSVAFSPDGKTFVSGSCAWTHRHKCAVGEIILWDVATRQPIGRLEGHRGLVSSVAYSPNGKTFVSGSCAMNSIGIHGILTCVAGEIILWDVATRQPIGRLEGHMGSITSVTYSPDGEILASASQDGTIILWDLAMEQPVGLPLRGHTSFVNTVAYSPDGTTLASVSQDGTIILWDLAMEQPVGLPLRGHTSFVSNVAYSPDGTTLASVSQDGTIILWDLVTWRNPYAQQEYACRIANRNLTAEEWQQYLPDRPYEMTCPDLPPHPSAVEAGLWEE